MITCGRSSCARLRRRAAPRSCPHAGRRPCPSDVVSREIRPYDMTFWPSRPRRSPLGIRVRRRELSIPPILCGLLLMAPIATPLQVGGRGEASGDMGLCVFLLVSKAVTAIDALDPVELGRLAQLQGQEDLYRHRRTIIERRRRRSLWPSEGRWDRLREFCTLRPQSLPLRPPLSHPSSPAWRSRVRPAPPARACEPCWWSL